MAKKFEFREFTPDSLVINSSSSGKDSNESDSVNQMVIDHFASMVDNKPQENTETPTEQTEAPKEPDVIPITLTQEELDKIKAESFNQGRSEGQIEAKNILEENIKKDESANEFIQILITKINEILPVKSVDSDYVDLIGIFLEELSAKLMTNFSSDFNSIVKTQLKTIIDSSYKEGKVIFKVGPENVQLVEKIIKNDELSLKIANIEVIPDLNISPKDCILEYQDTKLVYDVAMIQNEVSEIIKQFKQDS
ncbi:MAG: hypothetical protein SFT91_03375 [Rickettsiaceae bacterium]|nr:hypothetical protein [Rickettsiaceae bacterium]